MSTNSNEATTSKRDEYIENLKRQLDEMNARLDDWEKKADEASEQLKGKYEKEVSELREKSTAAKARLEELRDAGDERWDALVEETEHVKESLSRSFNYLKSQL